MSVYFKWFNAQISFDGDWAKPKTQDVRLICTRFETKTSYNGDWAKPKTQDVSLGLYMF